MDFSIYQNMVSSVLDTSKYPHDVILQLKGINRVLSEKVPFILDQTSMVSSNFNTPLTVTPVTLPGYTGTLRQLLGLSDGTFLVISSDAKILQYNAAFSLAKTIPFVYDTVATTEYIGQAGCTTLAYTDSDLGNGDMLFVCIPASHIVQIYRYAATVWTYVGKIGTLATPGFTAGLLANPTALAGFYDWANHQMEIMVSCLGTAPGGETSFIKKFLIPVTGEVIDVGVISEPTTDNLGSMVYSETKNIVKMFYGEDKQLYALSITLTELGQLNCGFEPLVSPVTIEMIKGVIKTLSYGDVLASPTTFAVSGEHIVVGDTLGHVAILNPDFHDTQVIIGRHRDLVNDTTYPLEFGPIVDLAIIGNKLYIISDNSLSVTNLISMVGHEAIFKVTNGVFPVSLKKVYGFSGETVTLSLDGIQYFPLEHFMIGEIQYQQDIYIKVSRSLADVIANYRPLPDGLLLGSL